ncbi:MAG TPA: adenosine-specific kinase [Syntrophorhabdaceae bacterium]|nr:adenosine-specific kinase [Syntrophorhabdaceae bacterium]HPU29977.1 adenosine-specific kinase [Syntrophorhabdaceae bacterium]
MEIKSVKINVPEGLNIIIGQSHFVKTVEDIYEILVGSSPHLKFGVAFSEASGPCLVRYEGNDEELMRLASETSFSLSCGHTFVIFLRDGFPINVLNALKSCQEVCHIICATANPLEVIVVKTEQGNGIIGVVDGSRPKGIEQESDKRARKELLRKFRYKL